MRKRQLVHTWLRLMHIFLPSIRLQLETLAPSVYNNRRMSIHLDTIL